MANVKGYLFVCWGYTADDTEVYAAGTNTRAAIQDCVRRTGPLSSYTVRRYDHSLNPVMQKDGTVKFKGKNIKPEQLRGELVEARRNGMRVTSIHGEQVRYG